MKTFRDRLIETYIAEARFPWEKFPEPSKGPSIGGNPDPMGSKKRDVSNIGPRDPKKSQSTSSPDQEGDYMEWDDLKQKVPKAAKAWHDTLGSDHANDYTFIPRGKMIYAHRTEDLGNGDDQPEFYYDSTYEEWESAPNGHH